MAKVNFTSVSMNAAALELRDEPDGSEIDRVDDAPRAESRKPAASMKIKMVGGYWTALVPSGQALMSFASLESCLGFMQGFLVEVVS